MTKKRKKKSKHGRFESVGWGFWLICFAVLYGPMTYVGYIYSVEDRRTGLLPWVIGFTLAAFEAGVLSMAVNYGLQKRIELLRKKAKKRG